VPAGATPRFSRRGERPMAIRATLPRGGRWHALADVSTDAVGRRSETAVEPCLASGAAAVGGLGS
jgi:hypothetical protein